MEITPLLIYWINVMDYIHFIAAWVGLFCLILLLLSLSLVSKDTIPKQERKKVKDGINELFCMTVVAGIIITFVPTRQDSYQMMIMPSLASKSCAANMDEVQHKIHQLIY